MLGFWAQLQSPSFQRLDAEPGAQLRTPANQFDLPQASPKMLLLAAEEPSSAFAHPRHPQVALATYK
jgi:hypothetical protein